MLQVEEVVHFSQAMYVLPCLADSICIPFFLEGLSSSSVHLPLCLLSFFLELLSSPTSLFLLCFQLPKLCFSSGLLFSFSFCFHTLQVLLTGEHDALTVVHQWLFSTLSLPSLHYHLWKLQKICEWKVGRHFQG
jgi:hypothetical protein